MKEIGFTQMVSVGCGIDVHQNLIVASIRKSKEEVETREFEAYTSSLTSLREWCKTEGVTHVAMESTEAYQVEIDLLQSIPGVGKDSESVLLAKQVLI